MSNNVYLMPTYEPILEIDLAGWTHYAWLDAYFSGRDVYLVWMYWPWAVFNLFIFDTGNALDKQVNSLR